MSRILGHKEFISLRDLSEPIGSKLVESYYLEYFDQVNEGKALDSVLNTFSKTLLGGFSRINLIDNIRKADLDIKKEIIEKKYKLRDDLDALEIKKDKARQAGDKPALIQIENEYDRKKKEYTSFVKMKTAQMDRGAKLMDKVIDGNERRKEYYDAGLADDEYELAQFEYELAKKKSEDAEEIKKLEDKFKDASKKADELIKSNDTASQKAKEIKVSSLSNIEDLKKKIGEKDASTLLVIKQKTSDRLEDAKDELIDVLKKVKEGIIKNNQSGKRGKVLTNSRVDKMVSLANEIDSLDNLSNLYAGVGKGRKSIDKSLSDSSVLSDIFSKINKAVSEGRDVKSGVTKEVIDITLNPSESSVESLIKKLS